MNNGEYIQLDFSMDSPVLFALKYAFLRIKDVNKLIEDYNSELWWYTSDSYRDKIYDRIDFLREVKKELWIRGYAVKDMVKSDYPLASGFCQIYNGDIIANKLDNCLDDHVMPYSEHPYNCQCGELVETYPIPHYSRYDSLDDLPDDKVFIDDSVFAEAKRRIIITDINFLLRKALIRHALYLKQHQHDPEDEITSETKNDDSNNTFHHVKFDDVSEVKAVKVPIIDILPKKAKHKKWGPVYVPVPKKVHVTVKKEKKEPTEEEIISLLQQGIGLKASEIASRLKCDRRQINHILYGSLRGKVHCDISYKWHLINQ